jgi:hypothetical protein
MEKLAYMTASARIKFGARSAGPELEARIRAALNEPGRTNAVRKRGVLRQPSTVQAPF